MICTIRVAALATLVSAAFVLPAHAQVTVKDPWVRATVSQQKATGAFMQITSAQDARLVEAKSPVAGVVEIHGCAPCPTALTFPPARPSISSPAAITSC
jgi:copper(I)-binding protein